MDPLRRTDCGLSESRRDAEGSRAPGRLLVRRGTVRVAALAICLSAAVATAGDGVWTTTYPYGGFIQGLAIDPSSPNVLYALPQFRGIYRSTDGAASWFNVLDGQKNLPFDRTNIQWLTVHATTGAVHILSAGGHFKSLDQGASWTALPSPPGYKTVLIFDPSNPSVMYAGAHGAVLKSTDAGATWTQSSTGLPGVLVRSIEIDPVSPNILYASVDTAGVFKSLDSGDTWSGINNNVTMTSVDDIEIKPSN